jgi:flagellar motility protein MotE (MotC chaperone)
MASKFKLTGFARFFFAMIIIIPLAYFGASYYNGEDGWANLKKMVGIDLAEESNDQETTSIKTDSRTNNSKSNKSETAEIDRLQNRVNQLEKENEKLKQLLKNREREIELLKQ